MSKEIKCLVWDLDNTLWEGTLLESDQLSLRPEVEHIVKSLDAMGILHSIASKNNHAEAIAQLRLFNLDAYFLFPEINWNAKSASIANIQKNLNIGADSIAFIDDQAFEREEVQSVHPEVYCLDAGEYVNLLGHARFTPRFITQDSVKRRAMYQQDMQRQQDEDGYQGPSEGFLAGLGMELLISEAGEEDLMRAQELTVRTNQLNATGRTYSYRELDYFRTSPDHKLLVCELTDKYGTYGKIGLALIETTPACWHLKLMLQSCRVMTRGVGTIMLNHIMKRTKSANKKLLADFTETGRNRMMYLAYKFANFKETGRGPDHTVLLENDLSVIQGYPSYVRVYENY